MLKAKTCKELIDLIEKIAPNEARILGLIKFELHSAYAEIGRRALQVILIYSSFQSFSLKT